ncbi:MAG: hypothetical protein WDZ69_02030 [Candidatus Pacearchaeota archaeon]
MKYLALVIIKFFFISALFVVSNGNLHLGDSGEREVFFDVYSGWLGSIFLQVSEVAEYVLDSSWLPENNFEGS